MESALVRILVVTVVSIVVVAAFALLMLPYQARLASHTRLRRLRTMSIDELAGEATENATRSGLRAQFTEASLFTAQHWDPRSLSQALSELQAHAVAADAESDKSGTGRWVTAFREVGLAAVLEAVRERPNDDEPRFSVRGSNE